MILEKINKPNDIKQLSPIEYNQLADEIRRFLIEKISKTGGHLASNLGVVELCPVSNASKWLSFLLGKPLIPPNFLNWSN